MGVCASSPSAGAVLTPGSPDGSEGTGSPGTERDETGEGEGEGEAQSTGRDAGHTYTYPDVLGESTFCSIPSFVSGSSWFVSGELGRHSPRDSSRHKTLANPETDGKAKTSHKLSAACKAYLHIPLKKNETSFASEHRRIQGKPLLGSLNHPKSAQNKASSNMLTAGAAAPAVDPKIRHCGGQVMSSYLLK